jgi:hypothetical protein
MSEYMGVSKLRDPKQAVEHAKQLSLRARSIFRPGVTEGGMDRFMRAKHAGRLAPKEGTY